MQNKERFHEAFAHTSHEVMGRRLEPFSLRHRFWLEALESPLVTGGGATMIDLEMAARVCSIRFENLNHDVPGLLGRGPGWRAQAGFVWRLWRRQATVEYAKFQDYFCDHGCPPATHGRGAAESEDGSLETMPGILGLVTALARGSGWEPETIWALSPGSAEWYLAGIFTHRGVDMRLKSEVDEIWEESFRRERAEKATG